MARLENDAYRTLEVTRTGDVLRLVLDHPESDLNAVDGLLHEELTRLFRALKQEDEARAVVLTGRGRCFSAGGHFGWFPTLQDTTALDAVRRDAKQMIWDLLEVEVPIVAALNGPAVGLGASIALFADPHVRVGLVAGDGGVPIWPLVLGPARAKQYLLTGDPLPAVEAERLGLVNRVVPAPELDAEAMKFAARLAAGAPLAVRYTKLAVNKLVKEALNVAFDTSTALEIVALAALREKRKPHFRGR
jgi:enoyl-CoA hydratase